MKSMVLWYGSGGSYFNTGPFLLTTQRYEAFPGPIPATSVPFMSGLYQGCVWYIPTSFEPAGQGAFMVFTTLSLGSVTGPVQKKHLSLSSWHTLPPNS